MALSHEMNGVDYSKWKMPDQLTHDGKRQYSCCNSIDCAPRASRFKDGHWFVQFEGRWLEVPDQKVENYRDDAWDPGDHMGHACINPNGNIYCFRAGDYLQ